MNSLLPKTLLISVALAFALHGAEPPHTELEQQVVDAIKRAQGMTPPPPTAFSVDFPGGSVSDFLNALSKVKGVSVSIIANEASDLQTPLPAFSLRNTTVQTVIQALMRLLEARGYGLSPVGMEPDSVVGVLARRDTRPTTRIMPIQFESFQLSPYLADQSIDDIVGAIRNAWELDPEHDPNALRLKFHPATSILLVSGPIDGLGMAAKIVSQLKRGKIEPKAAQKNPPPPDAEKR